MLFFVKTYNFQCHKIYTSNLIYISFIIFVSFVRPALRTRRKTATGTEVVERKRKSRGSTTVGEIFAPSMKDLTWQL